VLGHTTANPSEGAARCAAARPPTGPDSSYLTDRRHPAVSPGTATCSRAAVEPDGSVARRLFTVTVQSVSDTASPWRRAGPTRLRRHPDRLPRRASPTTSGRPPRRRTCGLPVAAWPATPTRAAPSTGPRGPERAWYSPVLEEELALGGPAGDGTTRQGRRRALMANDGRAGRHLPRWRTTFVWTRSAARSRPGAIRTLACAIDALGPTDRVGVRRRGGYALPSSADGLLVAVDRGARMVRGAIPQRYEGAGGPRALGFRSRRRQANPAGDGPVHWSGCRAGRLLVGPHGRAVVGRDPERWRSWAPKTGVWGTGRRRRRGCPAGLGPTSPVGSIYWSAPSTGPRWMRGASLAALRRAGGATGAGLTIADRRGTADGTGALVPHRRRGISWVGEDGARTRRGDPGAWRVAGAQTGALGYRSGRRGRARAAGRRTSPAVDLWSGRRALGWCAAPSCSGYVAAGAARLAWLPDRRRRAAPPTAPVRSFAAGRGHLLVGQDGCHDVRLGTFLGAGGRWASQEGALGTDRRRRRGGSAGSRPTSRRVRSTGRPSTGAGWWRRHPAAVRGQSADR
jgi:hypothetical protein